MQPQEQTRQQAILVAVDTGEYDVQSSLDELSELAKTAGAEVLAQVSQKRQTIDRTTCVGSGMLEEIAQQAAALGAELIIFDHELTGSQLRNIEKVVNLPIVDRTMLILDIFAGRALSREGKLQVELAQQKYRLPRLVGAGTALSRLGAGIGTRGPGESKLESDRRHIRRRIHALEESLLALKKQRETRRQRRKKDGALTAAIVGYTNAGKSTLLNALTNAGVLAEDKLFATLDPTARSLDLPDGRSVILVDTVGLIRRLPHHLIEAFRSTLEEAVDADLLIHLCDASNPEMQEQIEVTEKLLQDLGCGDTPILRVFNKCDLLDTPLSIGGGAVALSAKTGEGLELLRERISKMLPPGQIQMKLLVPYAKSSLIAEIRDTGKVFHEEFTPDGIFLDALVSIKISWKFESMRTSE